MGNLNQTKNELIKQSKQRIYGEFLIKKSEKKENDDHKHFSQQSNEINNKQQSYQQFRATFLIDTCFTGDNDKLRTGFHNSNQVTVALDKKTIEQLGLRKLEKFEKLPIYTFDRVVKADLYEAVDLCTMIDQQHFCQTFYPVLGWSHNIIGSQAAQEIGLELDIQNSKLLSRKHNPVQGSEFQLDNYLTELNKESGNWKI